MLMLVSPALPHGDGEGYEPTAAVRLQAACAWPVPTPKEWIPSAACSAAVQEAHAQQGPGKWDNPNTYNFCPIEARLDSTLISRPWPPILPVSRPSFLPGSPGYAPYPSAQVAQQVPRFALDLSKPLSAALA